MSKSLETLLDHLGGLYKFHGEFVHVFIPSNILYEQTGWALPCGNSGSAGFKVLEDKCSEMMSKIW